MSDDNSIAFRVATISDTDEILKFLRINFYSDEPIIFGNIVEDNSDDINDKEYTIQILNMRTSIVAIDVNNNDKIVGVIISGEIDENNADDMIERAKSKSKRLSEILKLLAYLEKSANVMKRYNVTKLLHVHVIAVDRNLREKSIGIKLAIKCMENAKQLGYKVGSVDCSSIYSIRIAEKLNMECVNVVAYSDYTDHNGRQLFKPPLPHTHIKTFIKTL